MVICLYLCQWLLMIAILAIQGIGWKVALMIVQFMFFIAAFAVEDELKNRIKKLEAAYNDLQCSKKEEDTQQ